VENILPAGRRRRLITGTVLGLVALLVGAALVVLGAGPGWFPLVFVPAFLGALMLLQARDRT
jgi:hypothetical protein